MTRMRRCDRNGCGITHAEESKLVLPLVLEGQYSGDLCKECINLFKRWISGEVEIR